MCAMTVERAQRLERVLNLLPAPDTPPRDCRTTAELLPRLAELYVASSPPALRRALERDLGELVEQGRAEVVNKGASPFRYRRRTDSLAEEDEHILQFTLQQVGDLIRDVIPERRLDRLWEKLLHDREAPLLGADRLRVVPDTLRLRPAELYPHVLEGVIKALAQHCALQVSYRNREGAASNAILQPQALVQRGPIAYLFALKDDEDEPVRLYALHRMRRAQALIDQPVRPARGFDLDRAIASGLVDFGQGTLIDLELRVRGYLAQLLSVCPLAEGQAISDEPEDSPFELRVRARVPSTGQLLRWLLGAGPNVEVVGPAELRHVVAAEARKMVAVYTEGPAA